MSDMAGFDDVAVILLEMQPHIVAASRTHAEEDLRRSADVVLEIARALALPIIATTVPSDGRAPVLIEELSSIQPRSRSVVSPFNDQSIVGTLIECGRRTLAVGGVSSEIAVLHTALDARRQGFEVVVLVDLCGGLSARTEATAFDQMRSAGVMLSNISSFFTEMIGDMISPEGKSVMGGLARLWSWGGTQ